MLQTLLKQYQAYMLQDVRTPVPHLAGPPGVGKSHTVSQLAELLGVTLHTVNVSRINPLEVEGAQVPSGSGADMALRLLHNPLWKNLNEGDIVLWDEFLRGFPEVYNALLDIFTSREVAGFKLPRVFFVAASNSIVSYDPALEDRLLHIFVKDIRRTTGNARKELAKMLAKDMHLVPSVADSPEMDTLISQEIAPMYDLLDMFKGRKRIGSTSLKGHSARNLTGQVKLRSLESPELRSLISLNNKIARNQTKLQYYIVHDTQSAVQLSEAEYESLKKLSTHPDLDEEHRNAVKMSFQLAQALRAEYDKQLPDEEPLREEDNDLFS